MECPYCGVFNCDNCGSLSYGSDHKCPTVEPIGPHGLPSHPVFVCLQEGCGRKLECRLGEPRPEWRWYCPEHEASADDVSPLLEALRDGYSKSSPEWYALDKALSGVRNMVHMAREPMPRLTEEQKKMFPRL